MAKYKEYTFTDASLMFCSESKLSQIGKYIQPKRMFGKLSNSLN